MRLSLGWRSKSVYCITMLYLLLITVSLGWQIWSHRIFWATCAHVRINSCTQILASAYGARFVGSPSSKRAFRFVCRDVPPNSKVRYNILLITWHRCCHSQTLAFLSGRLSMRTVTHRAPYFIIVHLRHAHCDTLSTHNIAYVHDCPVSSLRTCTYFTHPAELLLCVNHINFVFGEILSYSRTAAIKNRRRLCGELSEKYRHPSRPTSSVLSMFLTLG